MLEQISSMNLYEIGKLRCSPSKDRGEGLPDFELLAELRANEIYQVRLARNEAVLGVDVTARGSRIVPQAGGKAAGGCAAKGPEIYYGSFARIGISSQLVEQLALFQAE